MEALNKHFQEKEFDFEMNNEENFNKDSTKKIKANQPENYKNQPQ